MRVSVIIPVHDGGDAFRDCIARLAACTPPAHELVVVVDGGRDQSAALAAAAGATVIDLPESIGPASARNTGAQAATGDVLLFVDADVVVPPGLVGRVEAFLQDHPGIAAVIGSYDDAPADPGFCRSTGTCCTTTSTRPAAKRPRRSGAAAARSGARSSSTPAGSTAASAIRQSRTSSSATGCGGPAIGSASSRTCR